MDIIPAVRTWFVLLLLSAIPNNTFAQTSSSLVSEDPIQQYYIMKSALRATYDSAGWPGPYGGRLITCSGGPDDVVSPRSIDPRQDTSIPSLEFLVQLTLTSEKYIRLAGYPEGVWKADLAGFERSVLEKFKAASPSKWKALTPDYLLGVGEGNHRQPNWARLLKSLEAYQKTHPQLQVFDEGGQCGDGETTINVRTAPSGAKTWFLVEFHYRLCKAQGIDPFNLSRCDRWVQVVSDIAAVAGDYRYLAVWPDGVKRTGLVQFKNRQYEGATILIRK